MVAEVIQFWKLIRSIQGKKIPTKELIDRKRPEIMLIKSKSSHYLIAFIVNFKIYCFLQKIKRMNISL